MAQRRTLEPEGEGNRETNGECNGEHPAKKAKTCNDDLSMNHCNEFVKDPISAVEATADLEVTVEGQAFMVHSAIVGLASPVFAALLTSGMQEGLAKKVELPGKIKEEFQMFLSFLKPLSRERVNVSNVDKLLPWFDEYQVCVLKDECEDLLLKQPVSISRLLQAHRFLLTKQYRRCIEGLSFQEFVGGFEEFAGMPDVLQDVLPVVSEKNPGLLKFAPIFQKFSDSLATIAPVLKSCLQHGGKVEEAEIQQVLAKHSDPLPMVGALVSLCFDGMRRDIRRGLQRMSADVTTEVRSLALNQNGHLSANMQIRKNIEGIILNFSHSCV